MNKKHLFWIIPLVFVIAFLFGVGFYAHLQAETNRHMFDISMNCMKELYNITIPIK